MTLVALACTVSVCLATLCHGEGVTDMAPGDCSVTSGNHVSSPITDSTAMLQSRLDVSIIHQKPMRSPANSVPLPFQLEDRNGNLIESSSYEYDEQAQLIPLLLDGDRVLQLGGNIGTSCIAAAKSQVSLAANLCVEPSNANLKVLKKNIKSNNVSVSVLEGIVADRCEDMYMPNVGSDVKHNDWGLHPVQVSQGSISKGQPIKCESFRDLQVQHGRFNVIMADCEGCFPSFLQENLDVLDDLEVVVWERDGGGNHSEVLKILQKLGLSCPYDYNDGKFQGLGRSACWRTSLATADWKTAPTFSDGPKWGTEFDKAVTR